ncbi:chemotaxis protein CheW [Desulfomonile tiedjei]|uniref:Chemotaxis signal transduction protein n=1 Tax=Desulfomonile tiedjei (strain ATCC 49306 / DSM 6799 / DCB-1) TaxID=706587 RepID=I4BZP6_DESTA|nr:chemotaxis protein CheW [Desulfomonile tiedjei]AFM22787.1 chemotaxis signal transduction protein [Desulfomonile tiedjei DSM 6799]
MAANNQLVVFTLDEQSFALNLSNVERIVRAVEVTPLPDAPEVILGVINIEGRVVPVVNTRKRLGMAEKEIELQDLFIIVRENGHSLALLADQVKPVMEVPDEELVRPDRVLPGIGYVQGVAKVDDGMLVVLRLETIMSLADQKLVLAALEGVPSD